MLVLKVKRDQSIMIGDSIEVMVTGIQGDYVKLGFIAPREVSIHRKCIYNKILEKGSKNHPISPFKKKEE